LQDGVHHQPPLPPFVHPSFGEEGCVKHLEAISFRQKEIQMQKATKKNWDAVVLEFNGGISQTLCDLISGENKIAEKKAPKKLELEVQEQERLCMKKAEEEPQPEVKQVSLK
jgi:hypothetical protein